MYLIAGSSGANILFFILMNVVAKYRKVPANEMEEAKSAVKENPGFEIEIDNNTKL